MISKYNALRVEYRLQVWGFDSAIFRNFFHKIVHVVEVDSFKITGDTNGQVSSLSLIHKILNNLNYIWVDIMRLSSIKGQIDLSAIEIVGKATYWKPKN